MYDSPKFSGQKRIMPAQLRAAKAEEVHRSIKTSDSFRSDQDVIRNELSSKAARMEAESSTVAMAVIYKR